MKRLFAFLLAALLLSGCGAKFPQQYQSTYLDLFDTVTTVVGFGYSEAEFQKQAQKIHDALKRYHQLFDIYHSYEGINNLKTVNDHAGIEPVTVDAGILALLKDCKAYYDLTGGKVNVAMGSVLRLWHEARQQGLQDPDNARLPDSGALALAAEHTTIDNMVLGENSVFLTDPEMSLDVGAIAKGWACQRVAEAAPEGMLISVGGNVCATGPKADGEPWIVGIQHPDDSGVFLNKLAVSSGAVVTSGDYQRTYTVEGKAYHHIIDPATGFPAEHWRSVTVICEDSALADALSTALFVLPLEEGKALAERCGAQVLWVDSAGREDMTEGFQRLVADK